AEAVVMWACERILSLQIDVVADDNQCALLVSQVDAAGGIGENHSTNSHAAKNAHGECDLLRGIALIKVNASLHCCDRDAGNFANYHLSGVADDCGAGKSSNLLVGNANGLSERIGECAQAGAQHN